MKADPYAVRIAKGGDGSHILFAVDRCQMASRDDAQVFSCQPVNGLVVEQLESAGRRPVALYVQLGLERPIEERSSISDLHMQCVRLGARRRFQRAHAQLD